MPYKKTTDDYIQSPGSGFDTGDQIKVMYWRDDKPVETHMHDFIEIAFLAYGSCSHTYHGTDIRLIPGDVFVITPHEEHSYEINADTVIYNCLFYPEVLGEDWNRLSKIKSIYDFLMVEPFYRQESKQQEFLHLAPSEASFIENLLVKMIDEQEKKLSDFALIQKSYLITFLCYLGRAWVDNLNGRNTAYGGKRDLLAEAIKFMENNINCTLKIEDIAAKAYLSPNYFRKVFKEVTGITPIEYINTLRILKACSLLRGKNNTVSQVAEAVGINDVNYFSRLFKSIEGCTPSEFRKKRELY